MKQALWIPWRLSRPAARRAAAAIWALVVLSVLSAMIAAITWQTLASRRWLDRRQNQMQSIWLARSGLELAATQLLSSPKEYAGESVRLIPESELRIAVQEDADSPSTYLVTSEARYPTGGGAVVVRSVTRRLRHVHEKDRVRVEVVATATPGKGDRRKQPEEERERKPNE